MYVAEYRRVRWISPERKISTLLGDAGVFSQFADEGQPAAKAHIADLGGIVIGPDGNLHLAVQYPSGATSQTRAFCKCEPHCLASTPRDIALPSADGTQLYQFNATGRHLRTLDALTGVPLYTFGYDSAGRLTSVADRDSLVTQIERAANGQATAIIAPYDQRTALNIDSKHHLTAISNPAGETTNLAYSEGGLLARPDRSARRRRTYSATTMPDG